MEKTLGSLFDGIGGFPLAGQYSGFNTLWASEIEPFPIRVTKARFPQMRHLGDITKFSGADIEPVSAVVGGSPCQDLSVAGKRAGMVQKCSQCGKEFDIQDEIEVCPECGAEIEKTRSGLFIEQIKRIKEMREADAKRGRTGQFIRPRFMVWENVPGAFSSNGVEDFRAVLEETSRVADGTVSIPRPADGWPTVGAIMGNGFSVAWRVLDAQYWGVPQRRRRIFLVADFGGQSAPEILFKPESVSGYPATGGAPRKGTAANAERGVGTSGGCSLKSCCPDVARTLTARADSSPCADRGMNIVAIPINDQTTHKKGGCNGSMIGEENGPMYSLTATDRHAVAVSAGFKGKAGAKVGNIGYEEETAPTLQASQPTHVVCYDDRGNGDGSTVCTMTGDHNGRLGDYTALAVLPFDTTQCTSPQNRSNPQYGDPCHPLAAASHPPAIIETYQKVTGTLTAKMAKDTGGPAGDECQNLVISQNAEMYENSRHSEYKKGCGTLKRSGGDTGGGGENLVCFSKAHARKKYGYAVRRLTPLECERLQGFPDGWTDIPGASDSARYKALGNSVAVPCVAYIMRGIAAVLERMGDAA